MRHREAGRSLPGDENDRRAPATAAALVSDLDPIAGPRGQRYRHELIGTDGGLTIDRHDDVADAEARGRRRTAGNDGRHPQTLSPPALYVDADHRDRRT